jgi:hypothetical protein
MHPAPHPMVATQGWSVAPVRSVESGWVVMEIPVADGEAAGKEALDKEALDKEALDKEALYKVAPRAVVMLRGVRSKVEHRVALVAPVARGAAHRVEMASPVRVRQAWVRLAWVVRRSTATTWGAVFLPCVGTLAVPLAAAALARKMS